MAKRIDKEVWREFIDKFSSYEGTVTQYCLENNISKSQFYYHKRRFEKPAEATFHAISFEKVQGVEIDNKSINTKDIRIELGKANIFIPVNEIAVLSEVIKEIAKSC
jgi:hypothetical protein